MNISIWKTATSPHITVLVSLNLLSLNNWPPAAVFTGKYVMVMGVIQAISPEPVIRAVKIADLSELAAHHRQMWKLEVEDLQQVLAWMQNCWCKHRLAGGRMTCSCHIQLDHSSDSWQMGKKKKNYLTGLNSGFWLEGIMQEWERLRHAKTDLYFCIQYLRSEVNKRRFFFHLAPTQGVL